MYNHKLPFDPTHLLHSRTQTVEELFADGDVGFLVPYSYPEYIGAEVEVDWFVREICLCASWLVRDPAAVRFLGAITLLPFTDQDLAIKRPDPYNSPRRVYAIIDGQQRIATLALLASQVYQRLSKLRPLTHDEQLLTLRDSIDYYMDAVLRVFSFNLREGFPQHKPAIIHGRYDSWSRHAEIGVEYCFALSRYLGQFLLAMSSDAPLPQVISETSVDRVLIVINRWLDEVANAHVVCSDTYPTAWQIRSSLNYIDRRLFGHREISAAAATGGKDPANVGPQLCSLVQLVAFTYALMQRSCFTVITATTEMAAQSILDWRHDEMMRRARV